jgi:beta-glucanase (GH16 family)
MNNKNNVLMIYLKSILMTFAAYASLSVQAQKQLPISILPDGAEKWQLEWSDEFDYPDAALDKNWISQNGPSGHILSSRWRENSVVSNGTLKLLNKKEQRGGQEWTSGNIWSKKQFQYGYFECRYKYAAATATNNSFWLMTQGIVPQEGKKYEIDINEGHYPNSVNTNLHNWTDITEVNGKKTHPSSSKSFYFGAQPDVQIQLEIPVTTTRVRFSSTNAKQFHIPEFRIYNVNKAGYPQVLSETADTDVPGLVNFARETDTKITSSNTLQPEEIYQLKNVADGKLDSHFVTQKDSDKWVEFEFASPKQIGCIQFVNGYKQDGNWKSMINDYHVQYQKDGKWVDMATFDIRNGKYNFAKDFHTYGLDWSKEELVFYFDGKEIRRMKNEIAYSPSPIWLSMAIIAWAGKVTDAIDGTAMEVDYVRVFKRK